MFATFAIGFIKHSVKFTRALDFSYKVKFVFLCRLS